MKKLILASSLAIFLSACATPYQANGLGGGYSEIQINDGLYKVTFRGNAATSNDQVATMLLRRSAELTVKNGYKYFYIMSSNTDVHNYVRTTPTRINTSTGGTLNGYGSGNAYRFGNFSNYNMNYNGNYNSSSTTTITPSSTYVNKSYTETVLIKMSNKSAKGSVNAQIYLNNFVNK